MFVTIVIQQRTMIGKNVQIAEGKNNLMPNQDWKKIFKDFYDNNENGGSSRWLVAPNTVENFIAAELQKAEAEGAKRILNKWQEELRKLEK